MAALLSESLIACRFQTVRLGCNYVKEEPVDRPLPQLRRLQSHRINGVTEFWGVDGGESRCRLADRIPSLRAPTAFVRGRRKGPSQPADPQRLLRQSDSHQHSACMGLAGLQV